MKFLPLLLASLLFVGCVSSSDQPEQSPSARETVESKLKQDDENKVGQGKSDAGADVEQKAGKRTDSIPTSLTDSNKTAAIPKPSENSTTSSTSSSSSEAFAKGGFGDVVSRNWDALVRSIYVFGALSVVGFLYLGLRTWRLRRRRSRGGRRTGSRRYAPLSTSRGLNQEMEPLGQPEDEEEDEDTVFDTSMRTNSHA